MHGYTHPALSQLWLVEILRLQEAHAGPLDDAHAVRLACLGPPDIAARIVIRAQHLAQANGLAQRVAHWRMGAIWAAVLLAVFALLAGTLTTVSALGQGSTPVNIIWALGALLGVHAFTFMVWLLSLLWRSPPLAGLDRLWLWLTRKLAGAPDQALILPALINVLAQAGARRAAFGLVTHAWWALAFIAVLLTLLILLSTAHYQFIWATTLLAAERFVEFSRILGGLPAWLGFSGPTADIVRSSDSSSVLPAAAQAQWALWLIGLVLVYGLLPRLIALMLCAVRATCGLCRLRVDLQLPGLAALRSRLSPDITPLDHDAIVPVIHRPRVSGCKATGAGVAPAAGQCANKGPLVAALEWPSDVLWPPAALSAAMTTALTQSNVVDAGRLDSRAQRRAVLDTLAVHPTPRLLIACDAHMTPDRGVIGAVADLSRYARHTRVWLAPALPADTRPMRQAQWRAQLTQAGLSPEDIVVGADPDLAFRWLIEPAAAPPVHALAVGTDRP